MRLNSWHDKRRREEHEKCIHDAKSNDPVEGGMGEVPCEEEGQGPGVMSQGLKVLEML